MHSMRVHNTKAYIYVRFSFSENRISQFFCEMQYWFIFNIQEQFFSLELSKGNKSKFLISLYAFPCVRPPNCLLHEPYLYM